MRAKFSQAHRQAGNSQAVLHKKKPSGQRNNSMKLAFKVLISAAALRAAPAEGGVVSRTFLAGGMSLVSRRCSLFPAVRCVSLLVVPIRLAPDGALSERRPMPLRWRWTNPSGSSLPASPGVSCTMSPRVAAFPSCYLVSRIDRVVLLTTPRDTPCA
jgi:hypothetical protein